MSMSPVLTESARPTSRSQTPVSKPQNAKNQRHAEDALKTLEEHILMDGFKIVFDLEKSRGSYIYDACSGRRLIASSERLSFVANLTIR